MRTLILCALFFLALVPADRAWAMPPFSYDSALSWADETVTSDIPRADRIYILGPDKVTETYTHNGLPDRHDVHVRRAVQWRPGLPLLEGLADVPLDGIKMFDLRVYRSGMPLKECVITGTSPEGFKGLLVVESGNFVLSDFLLQKRDVILLTPITSPSKEPKPTL